MSKITLDEVRNTVSQKGWTLVSDKYVNLNTDLEFICENGHTVFKPYKVIRKNITCPICEKNSASSKNSISLPKKDAYRILALDQASLITGWSLWDGEELVGHGIFKAKDSKDSVVRISEMKNWVINMVENNKPDLVILEDIQLQDFSGNPSKGINKFDNVGIITFKTLSKLLGTLEVALEENKILYKVIFASTWRAGVGVKGRKRPDKKKSAQLIVKRIFDLDVSEDEADAICIGMYGSQNFGKEVKMIKWE